MTTFLYYNTMTKSITIITKLTKNYPTLKLILSLNNNITKNYLHYNTYVLNCLLTM
jgi:hypothetical protein